MDASQVADTFGVMATMAVLAIVAGAVAAAASPAARATLRGLIDEYGRVSAWLVAAIATAGSLWFSEAANFPPCLLCWYQRIAVYPLVIVLGVRALRPAGSRDLRLASLLLVAAGLVVNVWHNAIETFPGLDSGACDAAVPCTIRWVEGLGFFTIPRLATVVLVLIGVLLLADRSDGGEGPDPEDAPYPGEHPALEEDRT
jgi:hypothetical protein